MNQTDFKPYPNKMFSLFTIDFLFVVTFFVIAIFLYPLNQYLSCLLLLFIALAYSLLNLTIGYLLLEQKNTYMISMISIVLGISHSISGFSLLLRDSFESIPGSFNTAVTLLLYLRPYLTTIAILLICKFYTQKSILKKNLIIYMTIGASLLTVIFFLCPNGFMLQLNQGLIYTLSYVKVSIIGTFYLVAFFYLWDNEIIKYQPLFISTTVLFIFIVVSEVIISLSNYHHLDILCPIFITIPLYILYNIQIQSFMLPKEVITSTRQHLYTLNSELMNKFFTFKDTEVQSLRAEVDVKDGVYKKLFDSAPDAFLLSTNGKIIYLNQASLSLLHLLDKNQGLDASVWEFVHPDSTSVVKSIYAAVLKPGSDTAVGEIKVLTLDKKIKDVRLSCTMLHLPENTTYLISSLHDLSKEKSHQLIRSQLEENVAQEKFKVEFFANISHELKTPINVIYSAAQLQDICATNHEYDNMDMYNNVIKQNCLRLQKLLNDLLDITKLDANHFKARPQTCNIIYVIESITQSVTTYLNEKNITIIFDTNVEEKLALTDPDLIERILLNLISNAIKYGNNDGYIWVTLHDEGNHLIISVKDDGVGIPKSQVPLIFKRFHKVARNSDNSPNGNGIGLSLVKSIVGILGGNISCISKENQGSEFIVILPMISCKEQCHDSISQNEFYFGNEDTLNIELSDT